MRSAAAGQLHTSPAARLIGSLLVLVLAVLIAGSAGAAAAGPTVIAAPAGAGGSFRITTDPPLSGYSAQGNPDSPKTPLKVTVEALGPGGRPLRDAVIDLTMTAPKFGSLIGSDVPRAEGLKLLHMRAAPPDGRFTFTYVMPIRGRYRLDLRATPVAGGASFTPLAARSAIVVPERSGELLNLIAVLIGLLVFGLLSAIVLTRSQLRVAARRAAAGGSAQPGAGSRRARGARVSVGSLAGAALALLVLAFAAYLVVNQVDSSNEDTTVARLQGAGAGIGHAAGAGPVRLRYHLSRAPKDGINVRALLENRGSLVDARTGRPVPGARFALTALDEETGEPAFTATTLSRDGTFAWDQVFWDGVGYKLTVAADAGASGRRFAPISSSSPIDVQAMAPPLLRKFVAMLLLLAALVAGMLIGVYATRRRARRPSARAARSRPAPAVAAEPGG